MDTSADEKGAAVVVAQDSDGAAAIEVPALTIKQVAFIDAYLLCGNASEAYRTSYNTGNMLPKTSRDAASELLRHPVVAAAIAERRHETRIVVDAAVASARSGALVNVSQLQHIAAMDPEEHARQLAPIVRANETLATISGALKRGPTIQVNVDARRIDTMAIELWEARKERERAAQEQVTDEVAVKGENEGESE